MSVFSNARRRFLQRRHATIAETVLMQQLKAYRDECKEQALAAECAMATTLIVTLRFDEAIRTRTMGEWMGQLGLLRSQIKNLKHALNVEFEAPGLKLAASQSDRPDNSDENCPKCGTLVLVAPGIGPYCPNSNCDVIDNLLQVPTRPLPTMSHCPTCKCYESDAGVVK